MPDATEEATVAAARAYRGRLLRRLAPWALAALALAACLAAAIALRAPALVATVICALIVGAVINGGLAVALGLGLDRVRRQHPADLTLPFQSSPFAAETRRLLPGFAASGYMVIGRSGLEFWAGIRNPRLHALLRWDQIVGVEVTDAAVFGWWPGPGVALAFRDRQKVPVVSVVLTRDNWALPVSRLAPGPYVAVIKAHMT